MKTRSIKPILSLFFSFFIVFLLYACGANLEREYKADESYIGEKEKSAFDELSQGSTSSKVSLEETKSVETNSKPIPIDNTGKDNTAPIALKIIKNAEISIQVKDYKQARTEIIEITNKNGGIISSENQQSNNYNIENTMVIRVKSDGFDNLVEKLMEPAIYVDYKRITSDDVTEQYIDTEARLKTKKATAARFQEILKQASRVQDILEVQNEINNIQEEIESCEGKLRYLNNKINYSTITLRFYEKLDFKPAPDVSFFHKLGKAFAGGWKILLQLILGLVYIWPILLIIAIFVFIIVRLVNKKNKKN